MLQRFRNKSPNDAWFSRMNRLWMDKCHSLAKNISRVQNAAIFLCVLVDFILAALQTATCNRVAGGISMVGENV